MSEPDTCSCDRRVNPSIVIVAPGHADTLTDEFGRYARDYDVRTTTSVGEAEEVARSIVGTGGQVAMFVSESRLPDGDVVEAFARWRTVVPTARRLVTVHWSHFLEDSSALRPGLAAGKYDASLLLPRGVRDEEFHTAVCELLSDWDPPSRHPRSRPCGSSPRAAMRWPRASATSWTAWACRTAPTPPTPTRVEP